MRNQLLTVLAALAATGCAPGPCPDIEVIQASAKAPGLVQLLLNVQCDGAPAGGLARGDITLDEDGRSVTDVERWNHLRSTDGAGTFTQVLVDVSERTRVAEEGMESLASSAERIVSDLITDGHQVSLAAYDGAADLRVFAPFGVDLDDGLDAVDQLLNSAPRDPSTNLYGAINEGRDRLVQELTEQETETGLPGVGNLVLVAASPDRANRVTETVAKQRLKSGGVTLFSLALEDEELLEQLDALDPQFVATGFALPELPNLPTDETIEQVLLFTDSFVTISYCSPLRRERAKLTIELTVNEQTASVSHSYSTRDFGADCVLPEVQ